MFKWLVSIIQDPDWQDWAAKLRWQLISFKFLSFWACIVLLVAVFRCLWDTYFKTINIATELYKQGILTKDNLSSIIISTQAALFDNALAHILLFAGTVLTSIVTIKGVSYVTNARKTAAVINKMDTPTTTAAKEDLKQFLPKAGS
jgi:hypothetical protein